MIRRWLHTSENMRRDGDGGAPLVTPAEAAKRLGISAAEVERRAKSGQLRSVVTVRGDRRIYESETKK